MTALDYRLLAELDMQAAKIVADAIRLAKTQQMKKAIKADPAFQKNDAEYEVDIVVDLNEDSGAPEAAAYEYGSGLHGEKKAKYIIAPRNANALAFNWPGHDAPWGSRKFIGISSSTGKFLWRYVEHPGVKAEPFMRPAVQKGITEFGRQVRASVTQMIRDQIIEVSLRNY